MQSIGALTYRQVSSIRSIAGGVGIPGGEGVAYHDNDASNNGVEYRFSEGVDIQTTTDAGGGYNVGWVEGGEWMKYTVNVATSGLYTFEARFASAGDGGIAHVEFDGVDNIKGMNITFVTTAASNEEAKELLAQLGMPFRS